MYAAELVATAEYPLVVVGDRLPQHYHPGDAVTLASAVNTDILTVGDGREILPDGEATEGYLGRLDDHLDAVHAADAYLIVGVDIETAQNVPWTVFDGDGAVVTARPSHVFAEARVEIPIDYWIQNADADTLHSLAEDTIEAVSSSPPGTIYSHQDEHPDPPVELFTGEDSPETVMRCQICHTLSNHKVAIGSGYPGRAIEWQCPAVAHRNHDRLETLFERREQLRRRRLYDESVETGQRALDRVEAEHERLTVEIEALREWFDGRFDDIVGTDPDATDAERVREFEPRAIQYE
jgi:hypothetical protein